MKTDARRDEESGPELGTLRETLRRWPTPAAPAELERALLREFRRRHPARKRAMWVSLAAAATLLVAWQLRRGDEATKALPPQAAATVAPVPLAPAIEPAARDRVPRSTVAAAGASRPRPRSVPRTSGPRVIVEPNQAALLVELGRKVWGTRQAVPGTVIPQMPEGDLPRYRDEWQTVAGQSSFVQEPGAIGER
jgi:hypothetical protein